MALPNPNPIEEELAGKATDARLGYIIALLQGDIPFVPSGQTPLAISDEAANAEAEAILDADADALTYITGFDVTGLGATAALGVIVQVENVVGGPLSFSYAAAAGVAVANAPLQVRFPQPIPATAINTPINVVCPALGAGNTKNVVTAYGYKIVQ